MKRTSFARLVAMAAMVTTSAWAAAQSTVTFDPSVNQAPTTRGSFELSQEPVTLACTDGMSGGTHYRFYMNSTITVSVEGGTITQVVMTCTAAGTENYGAGNLNANTGSGSAEGNVYTWTGSATTVQYAAAKQVRASSVTVTYVPEGAAGEVQLTSDFTFWPVMDKAPSATFTITPPAGMTAYYTTNGSEPSATNGTAVTSATNVAIHATTTVKANARKSDGSYTETVTRTYTLGKTVNSIADFKALADGEEARLFLSDEQNARVVYVSDAAQAFVRDNSGAICFYAINTTPALARNQHLVGWITGKRTSYNGLPELVATAHTNSKELLIAEPVTEAPVKPSSITEEQYDQYVADWVTVNDVRYYRSPIRIYNSFSVGQDAFVSPYEEALVDLTGIAIPYNDRKQVAPFVLEGVPTVVFVVNENLDFVSPEAALDNVTVRLKRAMKAGEWTTLTVPVNITDFDGEVAYLDGVTPDNTMEFITLDDGDKTIRAGYPYLVKPNRDIDQITLSGVQLTADAAQTIDIFSEATLVGSYSPAFMEGDGNIFTFGPTGALNKVAGAETLLEGTRAWVVSSADKVFVTIDGVPTAVSQPGDVDGNNTVNGSDVTALYNYLLNGATPAGNADVDGNGTVNGSDVTALYNILLNN